MIKLTVGNILNKKYRQLIRRKGQYDPRQIGISCNILYFPLA
jgi:hypothetical protein